MMAEATKAGRGALIVILVVEALITLAAVAVGVMTERWTPVIIVVALAAVISLITIMRLNQLGK